MICQDIHCDSSSTRRSRHRYSRSRRGLPCRANSCFDRCLTPLKTSYLASFHFCPSVRSQLNQFRLSHRRSVRHTKRNTSPPSCAPPQPHLQSCPTRPAEDEVHHQQQEQRLDQNDPAEHLPQNLLHRHYINITQLPPEILARIFHYVYISPVVIFPFQAGAAVSTTTTTTERDPDQGLCTADRLGSDSVSSPLVCGANVVCTFEEEHMVIEDNEDIPAAVNAHVGAPFSSPPQAEGVSRDEAEDALWVEQGGMSCMSGRCSSSTSGSSSGSSSRNNSDNSLTRNDITESVHVDGTCLAIGATARVIEGTTNQSGTALISTSPTDEGQVHVSPQQPNNGNSIDNNNNNVHLTHFDEGYMVHNSSHTNIISNNSNNHPFSSDTTNHATTSVALDRHCNQPHQEIYIENDLFTLFHLCLTCKVFYAQAIRFLWRQRTLSTAHELKGFYSTMAQALALATRPKDPLNQQQPREIEAALRIKSLTLLDMCISDVSESAAPVTWASTTATMTPSPSFVRHSMIDHHDLTHGRTSGGGAPSVQRHYRHRSNSSHYPQHFDPYQLSSDQDNSTSNLVKWDQDVPAAGSSNKNISPPSPTMSARSSPIRERASWAAGHSSGYGLDNSFWPSFSSSSASTSQWAGAASSSSSFRTHARQKTSSIYSDIISPRLLHMVAEYCHALTDLTICIQASELSPSTTVPSDPSTATTPSMARHQPTITFSFLAGALPSLKRLTLAGVVCDADQNKTGSELLAFARTIQPLETLNIRSCQGISDETLMILAERSGSTLERLDFQGMDFQQSDQLTKVMKSFVAHCPNLASLTLSCMTSLDLDESLQAFVDCEQRQSHLRELQILGHDHMVAQQAPPQQQGMNEAPEGGAAEQQPQDPAPEGMQSVTTMCRLSDHVLLGLARLPHLARLTLYCTGMTDLAMIRFLARAPHLEDLVLHEPTPVLHLPQLHSLTHYLFTHALPTPISIQTTAHPVTDETSEAAASTSDVGPPPPAATEVQPPPEPVTPFEYTSASFLHLIMSRRFRRRLSSLFIKISIETAQDWILQPVFQASGLASCLYQYQNAHSGEPAVVLIWKS